MSIPVHIAAPDASPACTVLSVNMKRQYAVIPSPRTSVTWTATNGLTITENLGFIVEVTAPATPSDKVGAAMLTAVVADGPPIPLLFITVVDFQSITANFTATPSLRGNNGVLIQAVNLQLGELKLERPVRIHSNRNMPDFRSTFPSDNPPPFDPGDALADLLVLLRGRFWQLLNATVFPQDATVSWEADRNVNDNAAIRTPLLPSFRNLPNSPTLHQIEIEQNATGTFLIKATVKCACGLPHTGRALKLVLIEAKVVREASRVDQDYFGRGDPERFGLQYDRGGELLSWVSGRDAIKMDSTVQLLSGGLNADLYLNNDDKILTASWINNSVGNGTDVAATYGGGPGRRIFTYEALAPALPHRNRPYIRQVPADDALLPRPLLDQEEQIDKPRELGISRSEAIFQNPAEGQLGHFVQVLAEDAPNQDMPFFLPRPDQTDEDMARDPDRHAPITSLSVNFRFVAALSLSTVSAPWIIGVAQLLPWDISAGWTLDYKIGTDEFKPVIPVQDRLVGMGQPERLDPVLEANARGVDIEVWPPGTTWHIGRAAINPTDEASL